MKFLATMALIKVCWLLKLPFGNEPKSISGRAGTGQEIYSDKHFYTFNSWKLQKQEKSVKNLSPIEFKFKK